MGRKRNNFGPCEICNFSNYKNTTFRKLSRDSLQKILSNENNKDSLLTLEIGSQLCHKCYNDLVVYDRNDKNNKNNKNNKKIHEKERKIILYEAEYNELINKSSENTQLKANIQLIQSELDQLREIFYELFSMSGI